MLGRLDQRIREEQDIEYIVHGEWEIHTKVWWETSGQEEITRETYAWAFNSTEIDFSQALCEVNVMAEFERSFDRMSNDQPYTNESRVNLLFS